MKKSVGTLLHKAIHREKLNQVDFQVSLLTGLIVIISCYLVFFLNYYFSYESMIGDLQDRALSIHGYLDNRMDNGTIYELNDREDEQTRIYQEAKEILEGARNAAGVRYLYTAKRTEDGKFIYVVDGLPEESADFRHIGDEIEQECIPDIVRAYRGETVLPSEITVTAWGDVFISYFPMHEGGGVAGVLGIEFDAERQYKSFQNMTILTPVVIILFCLIASVIAVKWFRRISNPSYRDMSNTDFLTGLKNRNAFEVDLHNLDEMREKESCVLLSLDLDDLKRVNDTYGHAAGDRYIQICSKIIVNAVGEAGVVYRIGGDEFLAVLGNCEEETIKQIQAEIEKEAVKENEKADYRVSISFGHALFLPG